MNCMRRIEKLSAWLLLWVFVPMVVLSSVHIHEPEAEAQIGCEQCVSHTQHSGHLAVQKAHLDDCVLCRFLGQDFSLSIAVALPLVISVLVLIPLIVSPFTPQTRENFIGRRGPPLCEIYQ